MHNRLDLSLLNVGAQLPDWSLEKIFEDEPPQKEAFIGKPLLILFFSLGCPGCLGRAIPYANRIVHEMGDQMKVLGIHTNFESLNIPREKFAKAQEDFAIRFPFFKDKNYDTTFLNYGAGGTPHWILVDKNNTVVYSIFGSDPNNALLRLELKMQEFAQISFAE
jgi:thiol-disulfide isomerase/thioredoxin